ncbi:unnamed protein product [Tuber melanosporum]|uniref:(Perigord truffle) hypothetical protein n=1 Tax=Tuber melanosporum (strain Mel28) TaxID=656061 RepID=D5GG69_TUBMM|nr:uncharacterized protein GSTUM_00007237001 [Tuber melanosporum]CAZ83512.1 unnamed protein product [Tuber melanosporum]
MCGFRTMLASLLTRTLDSWKRSRERRVWVVWGGLLHRIPVFSPLLAAFWRDICCNRIRERVLECSYKPSCLPYLYSTTHLGSAATTLPSSFRHLFYFLLFTPFIHFEDNTTPSPSSSSPLSFINQSIAGSFLPCIAKLSSKPTVIADKLQRQDRPVFDSRGGGGNHGRGPGGVKRGDGWRRGIYKSQYYTLSIESLA